MISSLWRQELDNLEKVLKEGEKTNSKRKNSERISNLRKNYILKQSYKEMLMLYAGNKPDMIGKGNTGWSGA